MEAREQLIAKLKDNQASLKDLGVTQLGIFGSFARGEQHYENDVDVLVEMKFETLRHYMDILGLLESILGRKVDLVMKNTIKPLLRDQIMNETVYVPGS